MQGIFQRLSITQQTDRQLLLRELPLFDYAIAFVLVIIGMMLLVGKFWISAGIATVIALYFVVQGKRRMIYFDVDAGKMLIHYQTLLKKETVSELELGDIQDVYIYQGDDGGTQIILRGTNAEEMGISAYSNDMTPWKEDIVMAINATLHRQGNPN